MSAHGAAAQAAHVAGGWVCILRLHREHAASACDVNKQQAESREKGVATTVPLAHSTQILFAARQSVAAFSTAHSSSPALQNHAVRIRAAEARPSGARCPAAHGTHRCGHAEPGSNSAALRWPLLTAPRPRRFAEPCPSLLRTWSRRPRLCRTRSLLQPLQQPRMTTLSRRRRGGA